MRETKFCQPCSGSGKLLGGGMIIVDCNHCEGRGRTEEENDELEYLHLKTTDSYKSAIDKIKSVNDNVSDEEAEEIFKKELYNLRDDKPKRKKKG